MVVVCEDMVLRDKMKGQYRFLLTLTCLDYGRREQRDLYTIQTREERPGPFPSNSTRALS